MFFNLDATYFMVLLLIIFVKIISEPNSMVFSEIYSSLPNIAEEIAMDQNIVVFFSNIVLGKRKKHRYNFKKCCQYIQIMN